MNKDQENRRGRAGAVSAALTKHQAAIAGVPALVAQQGELNDSIALIDDLSQAQQSPTGGVTINKESVRDLMIKKALQVAGQLKAWASVTGNATVMAKADISRSSFMDVRDDLRDEIAQEIHDQANTNLAALADYGTTSAALAALQTRIDTYTLAVPSTRAARAGRKTLTDLLEQELRRADMIQRDRLDPLMEQVSETDATAYSDYKNARILVDTGGSKAKPAASATLAAPKP